jgi:hypothetical protein
LKYCNDLKRINKNAYYSGGQRLTNIESEDTILPIEDIYNKERVIWMGDNGNEG